MFDLRRRFVYQYWTKCRGDLVYSLRQGQVFVVFQRCVVFDLCRRFDYQYWTKCRGIHVYYVRPWFIYSLFEL